MKTKTKIRFDIVSLVCALAITILTAAPLFSEHSNALLLTLLFGSIGTGAMLTNLIHDLKRRREGKEK
jgi:hypothetical protein